MGQKITIDSATMVNKGLEVIEAKWLFGVGLDDVQVVVQPQSLYSFLVQCTMVGAFWPSDWIYVP